MLNFPIWLISSVVAIMQLVLDTTENNFGYLLKVKI